MNTATQFDIETFSFLDTPNETGSPERRLLLAILERAILDYVGNDRKELEGATTWIFGDQDGNGDCDSGEFSFEWVCSELDLDPMSIREQIYAMPKRGNNRIAPWYMTKHYQQKPKKQGYLSPVIANFEDERPRKRA